MNTPELEKYLFRLDKALTGIPVSEKAEIVTEIKSHILDAIDREPEQSLKDILSSLGEPEQVANKYLLEKGLKSKRAPRHPIIKWLIIGFLGTFAIIVAFLVFVLMYFSPVISINNDTGEIIILGGAIKVQDESIIFYDLDDFSDVLPRGSLVISGSSAIDTQTTDNVQLRFKHGKIQIEQPKNQDHISWSCQDIIFGNEVLVQNMIDKMYIDFSPLGDINCVVHIPAVKTVSIRGNKGEIILFQPRSATSALLDEGTIFISPVDTQHYVYKTHVTHGNVDQFTSNNTDTAIPLEATVESGNILYK